MIRISPSQLMAHTRHPLAPSIPTHTLIRLSPIRWLSTLHSYNKRTFLTLPTPSYQPVKSIIHRYQLPPPSQPRPQSPSVRLRYLSHRSFPDMRNRSTILHSDQPQLAYQTSQSRGAGPPEVPPRTSWMFKLDSKYGPSGYPWAWIVVFAGLLCYDIYHITKFVRFIRREIVDEEYLPTFLETFAWEMRRSDRSRPNYSPGIEDRLVEPKKDFIVEDYFRLPSFDDFRLLYWISPALAWKELFTRLRLVGERTLLANQLPENSNKTTSLEESEQIEQGKKYLKAGRLFLMSARVLNELAISSRLEGEVDDANRLGRLSSLRNTEAGLMFGAAVRALPNVTVVPWDLWTDLQKSDLDATLRHHSWRYTYTPKLVTRLNDTIQIWEKDGVDQTFIDQLKYQVVVLHAESFQICKLYQEAIPFWIEAIEMSTKQHNDMVQAGVGISSTIDLTNQLSHCYLKIGDLTRAWAVHGWGVEVRPEELKLVDFWYDRPLHHQHAAMADTFILKKQILEKNKGIKPI